MKLVIDIDDSLYDAIQTEFYVNGMRSGKTLLQKLIATIRNGTLLDDIRQEINNAYVKVENDYDHGRNYGLYMASQIIDNHIAERSE